MPGAAKITLTFNSYRVYSALGSTPNEASPVTTVLYVPGAPNFRECSLALPFALRLNCDCCCAIAATYFDAPNGATDVGTFHPTSAHWPVGSSDRTYMGWVSSVLFFRAFGRLTHAAGSVLVERQ